MMAPRKKLGEILLEQGKIDELQLRSAIGHQRNWGGKLGSAMVELGIVGEDTIARVLEDQLKERCLIEREIKPDPEAMKLISVGDALRLKMFPLKLEGNELTVAMSNPFDLESIDEMGFKLGKRIKTVLAVESCINRAIKKYYQGNGAFLTQRVNIAIEEEEVPLEVVHEGEAAAGSGMDAGQHVAAARPAPVHRVEQEPAPEPEPMPQHESATRKVSPSAELISKALAFILIEKGIIKRDELIEKMKALTDAES